MKQDCEHPWWVEEGDGHGHNSWRCTECGHSQWVAPWVLGQPEVKWHGGSYPDGIPYVEVMDEREPGEAYCASCPDHEACYMGYPCSLVKRVAP